ncbi:MAG: phage holin family protein, partial [Anaerovoracaceae bacterium]|nr:phage holin family protein [Anaerovoracaceae bacterium]
MDILFDIFETAAHNPLLQLVAIAVVFDTIFGVIRAIRDHKFNSCVGIDGAIRKIGMIISLALLVLVDAVIKVNLIGFVPEAVRGQLGVEAIGL